jgi:23S rRNA (uracil1939-C5)-methyltransferase
MTNNDEWLRVESMDLDGRGVARNSEGKVVFIDGALPGETVQARTFRSKGKWEQGVATARLRDSTLRVAPGCPHFGLHAGACGGCKMQHVDAAAQVAVKQRVMEDQLWHLAKVRPECVLRPIQGPTWGYRLRARLSVRNVIKKHTVLVGFHERASRYVADMAHCPVLPPQVEALLLPLRDLIATMAARDRLPQIELAVGADTTALVLRHLDPLTPADRELLREFGARHAVQWWLQPKGPETARPLADGAAAELVYRLGEFGVEIGFSPTDFTQVNQAINDVLVGRAIRLLAPSPTESVIDWFCGLGNFSLPIATRSRQVLGIEGSADLVRRAALNAQRNGLSAKARFEVSNLFEISVADLIAHGSVEKWLVDPPREGAFALVKALVDAAAEARPGWIPPSRIVYVSCNPATLARDAGLLVHVAGYRCTHAGVVNMFPHTAHVESMAVFEWGGAAPRRRDEVDVPGVATSS